MVYVCLLYPALLGYTHQSLRYVRELQAARPCTFLLPHDVSFAQTPYSMPAVTFAVGI
eukprot:gene26257-31721_t